MSESEVSGDSAFQREGLTGSVIESTYAGALSFMRRKYTRDLTAAHIAVTGIPFDQATSNRPGTRLGPQGVRQASANFAWGPQWPWMFDPFDTLAVVDYGDCELDYGNIASAPQVIEQHIAGIIAGGASSMAIGGDHYVTYPMLRAYAAVHGPLSLIQFDAHRDVEPNVGDRIDHGTMFGLAIEEGVIDPARSVQIGIRTYYTGERSFGMRIIYADEVHRSTPAEIAAQIQRTVGDHKAYLTFDIDCLDPAYAPGTGTPVPGGLTTHQASSILRELTQIDYAGMDLVEVAPPYDHAQITSLAGAAIALEYLCVRAAQNGARAVKMPD